MQRWAKEKDRMLRKHPPVAGEITEMAPACFHRTLAFNKFL